MKEISEIGRTEVHTILEEIQNKFSSNILVYSSRIELILQFFELIVSKNQDQQVFIIDPKRIWKPSDSKYIKIIRPESVERLIKDISEMSNYFTRRTALILVLDFFYYLRDYRGRKATDVAINTRIIAFILAKLKNQNPNNIMTIIGGYQDPMRIDKPLGETYFNYYNYSIVSIKNSQQSFSLSNSLGEELELKTKFL